MQRPRLHKSQRMPLLQQNSALFPNRLHGQGRYGRVEHCAAALSLHTVLYLKRGRCIDRDDFARSKGSTKIVATLEYFLSRRLPLCTGPI